MLTDENGEKMVSIFTPDEELILQRNSTKYLGVQIDNQLKWKDRRSQVSSEVVRAIHQVCEKVLTSRNCENLIFRACRASF